MSVCTHFFSLVFLKSIVHLECHKASKSVNGSEYVFQGCFKGVSRVFLRVFQGCFKGISRVFQGCFKSVSRKFK